jgi:hypothetical protein
MHMHNEVYHHMMSLSVLFRTPIRLYWKCRSYLLDYAMYAIASPLQYVSCDQYDKKTKYSNIFHSDIRLYSTCTLYIQGSVLLVLIYSQYFNLLKWWCYLTVDSAMAASQNGICSYNLSFHKKTKIIQIITKNITIFIYLIFYHRETVKL